MCVGFKGFRSLGLGFSGCLRGGGQGEGGAPDVVIEAAPPLCGMYSWHRCRCQYRYRCRCRCRGRGEQRYGSVASRAAWAALPQQHIHKAFRTHRSRHAHGGARCLANSSSSRRIVAGRSWSRPLHLHLYWPLPILELPAEFIFFLLLLLLLLLLGR